MRADTITENGAEAGNYGENAAAAESSSAERRPSITTLQNMLKKVSHSPNQNQYQTLVSSATDSSFSSANDSHNKQSRVQKLRHVSPQNGVNGGLTKMNHFYSFSLESDGKDPTMMDAGRGTSERGNPDTLFAPPPEFQSTPLDLQPGTKTLANGDLFHTHNHKDIFQKSTVGNSTSTNGYFHDVTLNTPDLFKTNPAQSQNLSKSLADHSSNVFADPFKSPSITEDGISQSPQLEWANPFYPATPKEQPPKTERTTSTGNMDVFFDPFPSPLQRDLFQDISSLDDPFGSPLKQNNLFLDVSNGTPDFFQPSEPFSATQPKSFNGQHDVVLTTPQGTTHDVLAPTPFTRARNLAMLPMHSPSEMSHVPTIRRPPKPLPRTRLQRTQKTPTPEMPPKPEVPPKPEKPPKPEVSPKPDVSLKPEVSPRPDVSPKLGASPKQAKLLQPEQVVPRTSPKPSFKRLMKPLISPKTKHKGHKPVDPDNYVAFEDILLIGQERCVEDWPEDSPQLSPDFKPPGKLRLRRESVKLLMDSDGGSGDDQEGSGSQSKKKNRRMSILSRRGSKVKMDPDGGSGEDQDGSAGQSKKKDKNKSILSIRSPKEKFPGDAKDGRSRTLSASRKSSKEYFTEPHMSAGEDLDQDGMDYKKKPLKPKTNTLLRRSSTPAPSPEEQNMNGHLPEESKEDGLNKKSVSKKDSIRRWSEGTVLDKSSGEEDEVEAVHEEKKKKKVKIKFVPHRGFAITLQPDDEPKGARGYTPRRGSKEKSQDEAFGYTAHKKSEDDAFDDVEEMKAYSLQSTSKDNEDLKKTHRFSPEPNEDVYGIEDCKPKKLSKKKLANNRRSSKEDMLDKSSAWKKKGSLSAEELDDDDELNGIEDVKPKNFKHKGPFPHKSKKSYSSAGQSEWMGYNQRTPQQASIDEITGKDFMSPKELDDSEPDRLENYKLKKTSKLKHFKKHKAKNKVMYVEAEDPPGATSTDFLSEAAKAEWLAAQKDEQAMAGLEDDSDAGDTDSLMEWWYTVEQWDEVPSDEEDKIMKEDESKSFTNLADKVNRGLRVFHKVFTERAEALWQSIITLHTIAEDISNFHNKAKIAGITGGTTTAVGGVTAIAGLALAPFTLGVSLVVTAVGVGVATAGGIASASAAISDNVNNMNDQKKVETVLQEYETYLLDIGKVLHFINQGLYKLRGHPFLRSGTQHYSEDWEIRKAVQMISLVDTPVMRAADVTDSAVASVQGLFKGIDKYFVKDSRELKKGCKKEMVAQIKEVANVLNETVMELNTIREELKDATGEM